MRCHVRLDGLAIADVELDESPKPDEVVEIPGAGGDGSPVIKAECRRRGACRRSRR
jgi:hypothetical protein